MFQAVISVFHLFISWEREFMVRQGMIYRESGHVGLSGVVFATVKKSKKMQNKANESE